MQPGQETQSGFWWGPVLWTSLGPIGGMLLALAYNTLAFDGLPQDTRLRAMTSAVVLSLGLGVPTFLFFSLKLRELALANARLGVVAATDGLTECLNRAAFTSIAGARLAGNGAGDRSRGALLIIDADRFKQINDRYGHHAGDRALTLIAAALRDTVRRDDLVGRLGGEEFGVYLPAVDRFSAARVAERLRRAVSDIEFVAKGSRHPLSVSIGGVVFDDEPHFELLMQQADGLLYGAKHAGRDRVVLGTYCANFETVAAR